MSENFHRAVDDLDRGGPRNFQDARAVLLDEVRNGADPRRLVDAINRVEMQPGHAGAQIRLATDNQGYLDIAPAQYADRGRYDAPTPRYDAPPQYYPPQQYQPVYEAPPPQYYPQPNPGAALGAGILGGVIGGLIGGAISPRRRY